MGTNDLAREVRSVLGAAGRHPLVPHLATALLAAREADKVILDGVFNDVKDLDAFRVECEQGFEMGFDGKTLIHPGQVDICNDVWAPSEADIENARGLIAAFDEGLAAGKGVVTLQRSHDREPPRRQRPARPRRSRRHRRPRLVAESCAQLALGATTAPRFGTSGADGVEGGHGAASGAGHVQVGHDQELGDFALLDAQRGVLLHQCRGTSRGSAARPPRLPHR